MSEKKTETKEVQDNELNQVVGGVLPKNNQTVSCACCGKKIMGIPSAMVEIGKYICSTCRKNTKSKGSEGSFVRIL
ncbi:MAG: hypothetical protein MR304_01950 [Eubacterium sp.]|nr:hypothetical protein [Eubacterium sp.]